MRSIVSNMSQKDSENECNFEEPSTSSEDRQTSGKCCVESVVKSGQMCNKAHSGVKHKLRSLTFGRRKNSSHCFANIKCKQNNCNNNEVIHKKTVICSNTKPKKRRTYGVWMPFKMCSRTESSPDVTQVDTTYDPCICTAYKKTEEQEPIGTVCKANKAKPEMESNIALNAMENNEMIANESSSNGPYVETSFVSYGSNSADNVNAYQSNAYSIQAISEVRSVQVRVSELALALRNQLALTVSPYPYLARWGEVQELTPGFLNRFCIRSDSSQSISEGQQIHTQIDYIHCLVPDLLQITNCSFYWGKMDRYEAERLLENKPEGTFLLRDSAQEEHLFSVSFRRFDRSLHARIEQWNHRFSFDSHDPGVYSSDTVCRLIEHYKDPSHCMFFEPMLTIPLHRNFTFSLQHLSRAVINSRLTYDTIHSTQLPKLLKNYLKEYHYKQQVRVRRLDGDH